MKKSAWEILKKEKYTEEGIETVEEIYDFITSLIDSIGLEKAKRLYDYWNEYSSETFWILYELVNNV